MAIAERRTEPLVALLHEAAQLEHCLLDTYLYAACSCKTLPAEFATLPDGRENRRRAIQFERVRAWKQAILDVAHEEMLHLHYVQCLIRALGAPPYFGLPPRVEGDWTISDWREHVGGSSGDSEGTRVPLEPLGRSAIRRFVGYESTDSLQDEDLFGDNAMDLFRRLHDFELEVQLESVLYDVADETERETLKAELRRLYAEVGPAEAHAPDARPAVVPMTPEAATVDVSFQSIADLYLRAILPLYKDAFHYHEVTNTNLDLEAELQDPNYAAEGFLPILPVHRDKNYDAAAGQRVQTPIRQYRQVDDVVREIVEEGEGQQSFENGAEALLARFPTPGGARAYLDALKHDADPGNDDPTPDWLEACQDIRGSHLYRFAITMIDLEDEIALAHAAGIDFNPARSPLDAQAHPRFGELAEELAPQFNSAYLALLMWLGRMYETKTWDSDRRRRMGIEMLAAWPMMSMAIRPFLELASFLPVDPATLFRVEAGALPDAPLHARELLELYDAPDRSQQINDQMDYYALQALSDIAAWAAEQRAWVERLDGGVDEHVRQGIAGRLQVLSTLNEFERQFPFREHGGYSDRAPDQSFQMRHPHGYRYEEDGTYQDPGRTQKNPVFQNSFVLRVRFAGRQLVQLATDPDPPVDEAGCKGTHMLHAADGDGHWFDRALVWQPEVAAPANVIRRGPHDKLPPVGVRVQGLDVLVAGADGAANGYAAIGSANSTGAVQAQGIQQLPYVDGLDGVEALPLDPGGLRISLLSDEHGRMPFLNGQNHLVSQDGEPIDPFIIALLDGNGSPIYQREIYNEGKALLEMSPLQRLYSLRRPCGYEPDLNGVPAWALEMLSPKERELAVDPDFPWSYLNERAGVLLEALKAVLDGPERNRATIDAAVSFAERLRLVANPRGTTVGWLPLVFFWGHTVSGKMTLGANGLPALADNASGLKLALAPPGRATPNERWFVTYNQGYHDTDALSSMVYGELFIPLVVSPAGGPLTFTHRWTFASGMREAASAFAARFDKPLWPGFQAEGDVRTITLADKTNLTEKLSSQADGSYRYTGSGDQGIVDYEGSFAVTDVGLTWTTTFTPADAAATVRMFSIFASAASAMTAVLSKEFTPASAGP